MNTIAPVFYLLYSTAWKVSLEKCPCYCSLHRFLRLTGYMSLQYIWNIEVWLISGHNNHLSLFSPRRFSDPRTCEVYFVFFESTHFCLCFAKQHIFFSFFPFFFILQREPNRAKCPPVTPPPYSRHIISYEVNLNKTLQQICPQIL